jgi:uncharacterized membrane protein YphA (DoxX/SURF4 family)
MSKYEQLSYAILRVFGSGIFLLAGMNHLMETERTASRLENAPFGYLVTSFATPELLVILSGLALLGGGLLFLAGYKTRIAALLLLLVLIPITITVQTGGAQTMGPLFKNIAIMGILIFYITNGSKAWSIDRWLENGKS